MNARLRHVYVAAALMTFCATAQSEEADPTSPDHAARMKTGLDVFRKRVRPALEEHCVECHSGESPKAEFDLTTRERLIASGHVGKSADGSYMLDLIRHTEEPHMPLKRPQLSEDTVNQIARWIDLGAPYDRPLTGGAFSDPSQPGLIADADRAFWSFRPLARLEPPPRIDTDWCRNEIDQWIQARQRPLGLVPNPAADRRTLIRRAYLDLLGLPPTPLETENFVADPNPDAYSDLVDQLLSSRHFGERWARHWMDLARFGESCGFEHDDDRAHAYHYRDFLIKAFNGDVPFNRFAAWQIAGDELEPSNPLATLATGFLGAGVFPTQATEDEFETIRYDELDDMVSTLGVAFLGLSVGCARCHDHKFDPIPSHDYYRFVANFKTTIRSEIALTLEPADAPQKVQVTSEGFPHVKNHADGRGYPHFYEQVHFLRRGDVQQKSGVASPGLLQVLMRAGKDATYWQVVPSPKWKRTSMRRAGVAHWITDTDYGAGDLLARVIVNRLWQHHFGRGIVGTPNDFGHQGEAPSHPQLLDWLASELISGDWKLKRMHKLMMTSSTYMQDSSYDRERAQTDPENLYHWRRIPRRVEAEVIRDSMLATSGMLDRTMYGPGSLDENMHRRSIYFSVKRSKLIPMMMLLDWPEHLVSIGQRAVTTTAPQSLLFMNSPLGRDCAQAFARRLDPQLKADGDQIAFEAAIRRAYQLAVGRDPTEPEARHAVAFIKQQRETYQQQHGEEAHRRALVDFCQALISSNEFVYSP